MYHITVTVHARYMAILHALTTTVPIWKMSNHERWNQKAAGHKKRETQKEAWKRSKDPSRSLIGASDLPRTSFGASDRSRIWIFGSDTTSKFPKIRSQRCRTQIKRRKKAPAHGSSCACEGRSKPRLLIPYKNTIFGSEKNRKMCDTSCKNTWSASNLVQSKNASKTCTQMHHYTTQKMHRYTTNHPV